MSVEEDRGCFYGRRGGLLRRVFPVRYPAGEAIEVCMEKAAAAAFVIAHAEAISLSEA